MTNKTLVRIRVWVSAWIKIYIHHTENTELLPKFCTFFHAPRHMMSVYHNLPYFTHDKTLQKQPCDLNMI